MKKSGYSVKVAWDASSVTEWFDSTAPLKLLPIPSDLAMKFRKAFVKGFIKPGANNLYLGGIIGDLLFGVLGFSNAEYVNYDVLMKADTTPSEFSKSTDLLLFCLRSKECKQMIEAKFNREINTIYSKCFTKNESIQRYKKHGKLISKTPIYANKTKSDTDQTANELIGYNLGYIFKVGEITSLKEAKSQFIQKSWKK